MGYAEELKSLQKAQGEFEIQYREPSKEVIMMQLSALYQKIPGCLKNIVGRIVALEIDLEKHCNQ